MKHVKGKRTTEKKDVKKTLYTSENFTNEDELLVHYQIHELNL